ncbi:hypothetical protein [Aliamphritea hakodatensis]|uniref:hypothetical protein n=1 Tax=Aliamphritea hakodatensis TaxID=2895352 RepID=UPI0022FD497B|nr:hypothetical protein [Aliamphritea hakodatensis]
MNQNAEQTTQQDTAERIAERLQAAGDKLLKLVGEQAKARSQIEQRWLKDLRQYHGKYTEQEEAAFKDAETSQLYVNITRNKTNAAEARLQDMLFPTDDRNWGIKPTPVPEMEKKAVAAGVEAANDETAKMVREAKAASDRMQTKIDDQLTEARYQIKSRDIIHDAALLGIGIVKGPVIVGRAKKKWTTSPNGESELEITETFEPGAARVDPWNFYPDMSARTIEEAEFTFEHHSWTKKELRKFAALPGVIKSEVKNLLAIQNRENGVVEDHLDDIRAITGVDVVSSSNRYEVWEYHGPIKKSDLQDAYDLSGSDYEEDEFEDLDDEVDAVVFFSDKHILKVVLNPMDTEESPYSVFNWEKDESSIFGFGVPYLMRNAQKVINAAWRMMMDNAGASVSDIIVVNQDIVTPADGKWTQTTGKRKLYFLKDKTRTVQEAFHAFSMPNHQGELANILTMARQLADEETNLPLIAQGEQSSHVTKTSSGMAMLMNSANIVLRRAVKNWDDDITRPMISRFYDWNMQFSRDTTIKGDFSVDARGSSALLVREKQQQNLMIYANMSASNPELAIRRDWEGMDKEIAKSLEVPHDKLTLTEDQIKEKRDQAAQQGNPEMEIRMAEIQMKQQQMDFDQRLKIQELELQIQFDYEKLQQERELKLADIASRENITIAQLQARTGIEEKREKNKRDIAASIAMSRQAETQLKAQNLAEGHDTYG